MKKLQKGKGEVLDLNPEESWAILVDLSLYDNESWNDPRDFTKPVKAIALPQDVPSTSDHRLIKLKNQVQRLIEAHLAPTQPTQMNKITTPCDIRSGPYDTLYCMENPEQAFVEYASSRTDEARAKRYDQQNRHCVKSTDRIAGTLPSDIVKNPKLGTHPVLSARSYPTIDPQCSTQIHSSINAIMIHPKLQSDSRDDKTKENVEEERDSPEIHSNSSTPPDPSISFLTEKGLIFNSLFESLGLVPPSPNAELLCTKEDDGDVMFIEIIPKDDDSRTEKPKVEGATTEELVAEYFDTFPTRDELTYHKYFMSGPIPSIFLRNPIIKEGCPHNLKIPCNIRHVHIEKAYIDLNSPLNIMSRMMYNWIMRRKLNPKEGANGGISNFTGRIKGMHVFVGNFTYVIDFMIVEDISSILDPRLSQVVLGRPFIDISNMTHDQPEGVVRFIRGSNEVAYKMPHTILYQT
nr:MAK10-like protein [Tanacetum cinerariifolium]